MSIRTRLLLSFTYVLSVALVGLGVPLAFNVAARVESQVRRDAENTAHLVAASASGRLADDAYLARLVSDARGDARIRVIIVDEGGILIADSDGTARLGESFAQRPEIIAALVDGRVAQTERTSDTLGTDLLVTAVPIVESGARIGAVRVSQRVSDVDRVVRRSMLALLAPALAAFALGLAVAWYLARSFARPLTGLLEATERVAAGDRAARAEVAGSAEQQRLARSFNEMADRVEQVLAAQNQFASNASHQLRTPLTGLKLRLESAASQVADPSVAADLEAAEREVDRLARLVAGLLALARQEGGGAAPSARPGVALRPVVDRVVERWEGEVGRIALDVPSGLSAAVAEDDLDIVFDNLIENAVRYGAYAVEIAAEPTPTGVVVSVSDDGPGFAPGEEVTVRERFARGSAARGSSGSGLGLAIVTSLVERWGGRVEVGNRPDGNGARILLLLPPAVPLPNPNPALDSR